jgi:enoyl-CoA hydratase/carnithine racemase
MSLIDVAVEDRGEVGTVATITVNNPAQRNALGNAGKRELAEAIEQASADPRLRVMVLTGAGDRSFIGGANVAEMATFVQHDASEGPTLTHRACDAIRQAPVPVIARINGYCFGAGLEIAASCDMRAAADTAKFGMPEVLFGLPSGMQACLLPQLIGWGKTRELVFTGRHIDAQEAAACHLVERIVAADQLDAAVADWVTAILSARSKRHSRAKGIDSRLGTDVDRRCCPAGDQGGCRGARNGRDATSDGRLYCKTPEGSPGRRVTARARLSPDGLQDKRRDGCLGRW